MDFVEQEQQLAAQLRECRVRLIDRVRAASSMSSPTRRMALYQEWRKELGDITARESAKFSEAVVGGRRHLYELERML
jgi:hypothetical protein